MYVPGRWCMSLDNPARPQGLSHCGEIRARHVLCSRFVNATR